jgi:hypothetical protein
MGFSSVVAWRDPSGSRAPGRRAASGKRRTQLQSVSDELTFNHEGSQRNVAGTLSPHRRTLQAAARFAL